MPSLSLRNNTFQFFLLSLLCSNYFVQDCSSLNKKNLKKFVLITPNQAHSKKIFYIYLPKKILSIHPEICLPLFFSSSGIHQSHYLDGSHAIDIYSLSISFFYALRCLYLLYQVKILTVLVFSKSLNISSYWWKTIIKNFLLIKKIIQQKRIFWNKTFIHLLGILVTKEMSMHVNWANLNISRIL